MVRIDMEEQSIDYMKIIIQKLILKMAFTALFIAACIHIDFVDFTSQTAFNLFIPYFHSFAQIKDSKMLSYADFRALGLIILITYLLLPIFRCLTIEISTDTIYLYFFLCQFVYYITSIKEFILNTPYKKIEYSREKVIPLEESLLIVKKNQFNANISRISVVLGFILIYSRVESNMSVLCLQLIGFLLYFIIPDYLDSLKDCYKSKFLILSIIGSSAIMLFTDQNVLKIFCRTSLIVYIFLESLRFML